MKACQKSPGQEAPEETQGGRVGEVQTARAAIRIDKSMKDTKHNRQRIAKLNPQKLEGRPENTQRISIGEYARLLPLF
jgi:hypothetical protein